jgi:hypothetical protein
MFIFTELYKKYIFKWWFADYNLWYNHTQREVNCMANEITLRARIATRVHNALKEGPITMIDNTEIQEAIFQVAIEAALVAVEEYENEKAQA